MSFDWTTAASPAPPQRDPVTWVRCRKATPCPICGRPDWCSVADDRSAVHCMREPSAVPVKKQGGGWIHRLGEATPPPPTYTPPPRVGVAWLDVPAILARWPQPPEAIDALARALGVSAESLRRVGARPAIEHKAWAFPMSDAAGLPIGIRLRADDGAKWCVTGSRQGLFIPAPPEGETRPDVDGPLLITEGPTDLAAALTMGFDAIARPSCSGSHDLVSAYLRGARRRDVVIVADNDAPKTMPDGRVIRPGQEGAAALAGAILGVARSVKVITAAPVKDLRQFLQTRGVQARGVLIARIKAAYFFRPPETPGSPEGTHHGR